MANQQWVSLLSANNWVAPAALSSATNAILSPTSATTGAVDIAQVNPGNQAYGWYPGLLMRVTARGYITTTGTSGTLVFAIQSRIGNTGTSYVTLAQNTAFNTGTGTLTGVHWDLDCLLRCTAINKASGASISSQGRVLVANVGYATAPGTIGTAAGLYAGLGSATGENAATVDTTNIQGINLQCTQATSACTVQLTEWLVEALD